MQIPVFVGMMSPLLLIPGATIITVKLTRQELENAIDMAKKKKTLESILLASNRVVVNQFSDMPLAKFWEDNIGEIRLQVMKMFDTGMSN